MSQPAQGHAGPLGPLPLNSPRTNWPCPWGFWNPLARDRRCETCEHWEIPEEREEERLQAGSKQLPLCHLLPPPQLPFPSGGHGALWGGVPEACLRERALSSLSLSLLTTYTALHGGRR